MANKLLVRKEVCRRTWVRGGIIRIVFECIVSVDLLDKVHQCGNASTTGLFQGLGLVKC